MTSTTGTSEMTKSIVKASDKPHAGKDVHIKSSTSSFRANRRSLKKSSSRKEPYCSVKNLEELDLAVKSSKFHDDRLEKVWVKLFGAVAAVDVLTTILPPMFREKEARNMALALEEAESKRKLPTFLTFWKKDPSSILDLTAEQCVDGVKCMYERTIHWMEDHRIIIGWIFCVCWIIDSVRKAYLAWISASELEKTSSPEAKPRDNMKAKELCSLLVAPPNLAFAKTLLLRLSMLPIGFFMLSLVDHFSILKLDESSSIDQSQVDLSKGISPAHHVGDFSSNNNQQYCVLVVIILQFKAILLHFLKDQIASLTKVYVKKIAPRIFRFAFLNPRLFKKRVASLLVFLRWLKYLIPLFQKSEKIIKTFVKIIKIRRQRYQAAKAQEYRRKVFNNLSPEKQADIAAKRLQARFRAKKARQEVELKRILRKGREAKAYACIQSVLLVRAAKAKVEIQRKKKELLDLTKKASLKDADNRRLKYLQLEIGNISKEKQLQKMLLRPDSKFIIGWKIMFMVCIGIEMWNKAFPPKLVENMDETMSLNMSLEGVFVPERIEDWASCMITVESKRFLGIFNASTANDTFDYVEVPWYCHAPYTTLQSTYIHVVRLLIQNSLSLMGIILYVDVFVNFFTGIYNEQGFVVANTLVPRWIFPGIGFQLLVNPKMKDLSALLKNGLQSPGPARLYQWLVAFVLPMLAIIAYWLKWNVWMHLVSSENKKTLSKK